LSEISGTNTRASPPHQILGDASPPIDTPLQCTATEIFFFEVSAHLLIYGLALQSFDAPAMVTSAATQAPLPLGAIITCCVNMSCFVRVIIWLLVVIYGRQSTRNRTPYSIYKVAVVGLFERATRMRRSMICGGLLFANRTPTRFFFYNDRSRPCHARRNIDPTQITRLISRSRRTGLRRMRTGQIRRSFTKAKPSPGSRCVLQLVER
jgi:hypothetical protein